MKKIFTTLLATVITFAFSINAFAFDMEPYNEFLRFRARGTTQGDTVEWYALYDLNSDGIKEAIVEDQMEDYGVPIITVFVAGKNYLNHYNDNEFRVPSSMESSFLIGSDRRLYILYTGDSDNIYYRELNRMDYDGENLNLVNIFKGDIDTESLKNMYNLTDSNLNWRSIRDRNISESDIVSYTEGWKNNGRWWYQNGDGTYPVNSWKAISDAWYYFDGSGYMLSNQWISGEFFVGNDGAMLVNTTTPDGYFVGADGKWIR